MKKSLKYILKPVLPMLIVLASVIGCDSYLDINTDPNNPLDSRLGLVLPVAQSVIFEALGNGGGGMSDITSQLVHQTVQRQNTNFYLTDKTLVFFNSNPIS